MSDMADYYNELQEEGGRYFPPGDPYRVRVVQKPPSVGKCRMCGAYFIWGWANGKQEPQDMKTGALARHTCDVSDDFDEIAP